MITNVSILTDPAYFVPPSCHCGILALRSHDFWELTLTAKHVFGLLTFYRRFCTSISLSVIKIFIQPRVKYFIYINQKCYFLLWLFQLRWTLIQHVHVFHVKNRTRVLLLELALKSHVKRCDKIKVAVSQIFDRVKS
jgi:hypothetical protein